MPHSTRDLRVAVLADALSVCRLDADAPVPAWATAAPPFASITRTRDELSIICATAAVPFGVEAKAGWCALQLVGPFAFSEVGVLVRVAVPLAEAGVSVLPVATYDTDYVLVRAEQLGAALAALRAAGHTVAGHTVQDASHMPGTADDRRT